METKRRMLMAHESQVAWVARQHGIADYCASMVAWAERRGRDFGVRYAEGFRHYRNQPYPRDAAAAGAAGRCRARAQGLADVEAATALTRAAIAERCSRLAWSVPYMPARKPLSQPVNPEGRSDAEAENRRRIVGASPRSPSSLSSGEADHRGVVRNLPDREALNLICVDDDDSRLQAEHGLEAEPGEREAADGRLANSWSGLG